MKFIDIPKPVETNNKHMNNVGKMIQLVEDCKMEEKVPTLDDTQNVFLNGIHQC